MRDREALVQRPRIRRASVFEVVYYACLAWQRTESGRPHAGIRLRTAQPMVSSTMSRVTASAPMRYASVRPPRETANRIRRRMFSGIGNRSQSAEHRRGGSLGKPPDWDSRRTFPRLRLNRHGSPQRLPGSGRRAADSVGFGVSRDVILLAERRVNEWCLTGRRFDSDSARNS